MLIEQQAHQFTRGFEELLHLLGIIAASTGVNRAKKRLLNNIIKLILRRV